MIYMRIVFFLMVVLLTLGSCRQKEIYQECDYLENSEIINSSNYDWFTQVYLYKDELYFVEACKICELISVATDCNGKLLCEPFQSLEEWFSENGGAECMNDFFQSAEHQFDIIKK